jgi:cysteine desulfurase
VIYLDHGSTTPECSASSSARREANSSFGNPNNLHFVGRSAKELLRLSENSIRNFLGTDQGVFYWTSSASQANYFALLVMDACRYTEKNFSIVCTPDSHKSVIESLRFCNSESIVTGDFSEVCSASLSFPLVNNETGFLNKFLPQKDFTLKHADITAAIGKISIDLDLNRWDLATFSAHKVYGPKGLGCLWLRDVKQLRHLPYSGTPPVSSIVGLAAALNDLNHYTELLKHQTDVFLTKLYTMKQPVNFSIPTIPRYHTLPGILSLRFPGVDAIELAIRLEEEEILISTGAACSTGDAVPSRTLRAQGMSDQDISEVIRITFGRHKSLTDYALSYAAEKIITLATEIRR